MDISNLKFVGTRRWHQFWANVNKTSRCWIWEGQRSKDGYGRFDAFGVTENAHRIAYREIAGEIPADRELDHLCRNRACVNPEHLEAVSHEENCSRGTSFSSLNSRKTRCPKGHPLDLVRRNGWRGCRTCENARKRESYARNREATLNKRRASGEYERRNEKRRMMAACEGVASEA